MKELSIEERELLLRDLCARLPYHVKIEITVSETNKVIIEEFDYMWLGILYSDNPHHIIKPYLRPMSSMTEDEKMEIYNWLVENDVEWLEFSKLRLDKILIAFDSSWLLVNWLLKNHFDLYNLIDKGLAIEAPEGMYDK